MRELIRLAAGACGLFLAACATVPAPSPLPDLRAVPRSFEMSGRLSVRQADRTDIARLRWTHQPAADVWSIASPLGNEVARIESSPSGATLQRAGGEPETAPSFSSLTLALLGVELEPSELAMWLHGGPRQEPPGGWSVQIEETQPAGRVELARRIVARRGDVVVRLVVDDYRALAD